MVPVPDGATVSGIGPHPETRPMLERRGGVASAGRTPGRAPCSRSSRRIRCVGIDAAPVEVEVDVSAASMPKIVLVGLAEAAVRESTHRVERALVNSGYRRPIDRVVINLAPADLKKDAGGFDLPIALGLLLGSGQASLERPGDFAVVGELALDGETRPIKGVLAMALAAAAEGKAGLLVPVGQRRRGGRRRGDRRLPDRQPRRGRRVPLRAARHRAERRSTSTRSSSRLTHYRGRLRRRQGAGLRQAGPGDRGVGQPQRPDDRPAGDGQDAAGQAAAARSCRR